METRQINCGRYSLPIKIVTECACQSCVEPKVLVRGRVVAADNDEPLRFGHIFMGNERVGTTGLWEAMLEPVTSVNHPYGFLLNFV